jgi:hypothetical protein
MSARISTSGGPCVVIDNLAFWKLTATSCEVISFAENDKALQRCGGDSWS